MRDYVFINEDGTVHNILNLKTPEAIQENDDLKDLLWFDYTDWAYDDKPAPSWTYNKETEEWTKPLPPLSNLAPDQLHPVETPDAFTTELKAHPDDLGGAE
jgi:hypothetical protein